MKIWIHKAHRSFRNDLRYWWPRKLTLNKEPAIYRWFGIGFTLKDK